MPAPQLSTNFDISQIFLGRNFYIDKNYTNNTGSIVTILPGTVLGTILTSNTWNLQQSTNSDGSQYPTAVASDTQVVAIGATVVLNACIKGDVNQSKLIFTLITDTLNTPVGAAGTGGGSIQDLITRNTDIMLINSIEASIQDPNQ